MNKKRGSLPAHRRDVTLDCSPLRKSVAAFTAEEVLLGSQQPVWGPPSGTAASSLRGSGDSGDSGSGSSLRGSSDSSDRIPAHRGIATSSSTTTSINGLPPAAAPQGSAWNPWQEHSVPPPPLPPRRVVAHRPSPSWFSPMLGFGGPASCVWQEEEQRRSLERQQAQQAQQWHTQPPPQQQQPQAEQQRPQPLPRQQHPQAARKSEQLAAGPPSIPWYQQGWQQQPRQQPQQRAAQFQVQYPGGNPFPSEPCGPVAAAPVAASGQPCLQHPAGGSQLGDGSTSGRKLPPPPRFLLARQAQQPLEAPQSQLAEQSVQQQAAVPAPAACPALLPVQQNVQQPSSTDQTLAREAAACPADAMQDVQLHASEPLATSSTTLMHSRHPSQDADRGDQQTPVLPSGGQQQQQQQQQQPAQAPPAVPPAGTAKTAAEPPPPPPPPPARPAGQQAGAQHPQAPPPPPARRAARPAGALVPPPPPPKLAPIGPVSHPLPQPPLAGVAVQPRPQAPAPAAPAAGSALSAIRADELMAAAVRLRKVQPGADVQQPAGREGSSTAACTPTGAAAAMDPRSALLDQIKKGVKLRPTEARKQGRPPAPVAATAGPLGHATPSMAELLRKVLDARRVNAGDDSDSGSEWGA